MLKTRTPEPLPDAGRLAPGLAERRPLVVEPKAAAPAPVAAPPQVTAPAAPAQAIAPPPPTGTHSIPNVPGAPTPGATPNVPQAVAPSPPPAQVAPPGTQAQAAAFGTMLQEATRKVTGAPPPPANPLAPAKPPVGPQPTAPASVDPFEGLPFLGVWCADCGHPQYLTPGGESCRNGHGGAGSVDQQGLPTSGPVITQEMWEQVRAAALKQSGVAMPPGTQPAAPATAPAGFKTPAQASPTALVVPVKSLAESELVLRLALLRGAKVTLHIECDPGVGTALQALGLAQE